MLKKCTQRIVINGFLSNWEDTSSEVLQGSVLHPELVNIFMNDLDNGVESMLYKIMNDAKLGGIANTLEDKIRIQKTLTNWRIGLESTR